MISVENLYWILFENLLKPTNITCTYYHPFGTTNALIRNEFDTPQWPNDQGLVLFHYDQEPIYSHDQNNIFFGANGVSSNYFKAPRILANSERSSLKKKICADESLLDWYYFYHGFAALDWYRDAQYLDLDLGISNAFCSLNNLVTDKRSYRMALTARLVDRDIFDCGTVSFNADWHDCYRETQSSHSELSVTDKKLIIEHLVDKKIQHLSVDRYQIDGNASARFGVQEYVLKQKSFLHVVNETVYFDTKHHLTEKIFQPIVHMRPFILVCSPGSLGYLRDYGFKTFDRFINEDYDLILDHSARLDAIADEIHRIARLSHTQLKEMLGDMQEILRFNKLHFFNEFRHIIVEELVENFQQCLRIWNNGRIKYGCQLHPNLAQAKKILLS